MAHRVFGVVSLFLLLLGVGAGEAQVRQITGRITNAQTDQGVPEATIAVLGTQIVAQAGNDGRFTLNAPDRPTTLVIRSIGFKRQQVAVPAGQETVSVALEPDVFKLEEIVITGQATGVEKRNLANAVATVDASELTRAPTATLESALQGKIPGATIQANSGAPGGGVQVNLRGVSTIIGDLEPLYVVDGIAISDVSIPNGANAVTAAQAGGNPRNQDNAVNRIADLNPDDIERIEVLKGGSAAAIYGSKATNGVIIITTKRGQVGKPQFNLTQRFGVTERSNELGSRTFADTTEAFSFSSDTALVRSVFQPGRTLRFREGHLRAQAVLLRDRRQHERRHGEHALLRVGAGQGRRRHRHQHRLQEAVAALQSRPGAGRRLPAAGERERHPQPLEARPVEQRQLGHQPLPGVPLHAEFRRPAPAGERQPALRFSDQSVRAQQSAADLPVPHQ